MPPLMTFRGGIEMVEAKHEFIDDNQYLVYTSQDTIVYSDKADTSIYDIAGGGQEYEIKCYAIGGTPQEPVFTEVDPCACLGEWNGTLNQWVRTGDIITKAKAGTSIVLSLSTDPTILTPILAVTSDDAFADAISYVKPENGASFASCPMPADNARFYYFAS